MSDLQTPESQTFNSPFESLSNDSEPINFAEFFSMYCRLIINKFTWGQYVGTVDNFIWPNQNGTVTGHFIFNRIEETEDGNKVVADHYEFIYAATQRPFDSKDIKVLLNNKEIPNEIAQGNSQIEN